MNRNFSDTKSSGPIQTHYDKKPGKLYPSWLPDVLLVFGINWEQCLCTIFLFDFLLRIHMSNWRIAKNCPVLLILIICYVMYILCSFPSFHLDPSVCLLIYTFCDFIRKRSMPRAPGLPHKSLSATSESFPFSLKLSFLCEEVPLLERKSNLS